MALHIFKSARAALEVTRGTDLTPTRLLYFDEGEHQQDVRTIRPQQLRNSYFGWYSATAGTEVNSAGLRGALSFDDLIWHANTSIKGVASGTGAGADKTWTFTPSAAVDDVKSAAMQFGYSDNIGATRPVVRLNYLLGDELMIKWDKAGDGIVSFDQKFVTPKAAVQLSAFTGALSDRTVQLMSCNSTVVTIDSGTIGTTPDNYWIDAAWTLQNGYKNLYTLNNTTAAQDTFRPNARAWKFEGTRYYADDTEWDAYVSKTIRKIRVRTTGPSLGGSAYSATLDLYGVYTDMKTAEVDGLGVQKFTLEPIFDTGVSTDFSLVVVNATASIT